MFDLDLIPETPERRAGASPDPDPASGARIAGDCSYAVAKLLGPWKRNGANYQRDAVAQAAAEWAIKHPERLQDRPTWERRALLRDVCKGILRDTRDWRDSLEDYSLRDPEGETRDRERRDAAIRGASVAEQARLYREAERKAREPMFTSLDALADRSRDPESGRIEWDTVAADLAAETEAGETLPASEIAADTPELSERVAERVAERLQYYGIPLTALQLDAVTVALMVAHGARLADIAEDRGCSQATAKRRSAEGMTILRTLPALGIDLVRERRSAVAAMIAEDRETFPDDCLPASVAEVDALYSLAPYRDAIEHVWKEKLAGVREQRKIARVTVATTRKGRKVRATYAPARTGSPRDVLAHIARIEHALDIACSPAWTLDTSSARPVPATLQRGLRSMSRSARPLACWQDPAVSVTASVSGNHPASPLWPNDTAAGQATYRWPHKAILRDVLAHRAGEHCYSTAAYAVRATDTNSDA